LVVAAMLCRSSELFRGKTAAVAWAVVAGFWGLAFGPLMYIPYFCIMGGWKGYLAMWIAGIPFDLVHCAGNFAATLVLYLPLYRVLCLVAGDPPAQHPRPAADTVGSADESAAGDTGTTAAPGADTGPGQDD
ncbi:MAG: hypothetical protein IK095_01715, partial [Oscillospiraceae bacterium]|nr:hypothetical protein [Oscillospiraceae bacterium]